MFSLFEIHLYKDYFHVKMQPSNSTVRQRRVLLPTPVLRRPAQAIRRPQRGGPGGFAVRRNPRVRRQIVPNAAQDVYDTLKRALNKPTVVLVLAAVVIFWIDHYDKSGFVHRKCDGSASPLCKWFTTNFNVAAGLVIFAPALYDLPSPIILTATAVSYGAILLLPAMEFWVYAAAAFALHTYFTSRTMHTRLLVIVLAILVFLIFRK